MRDERRKLLRREKGEEKGVEIIIEIEDLGM